ncbi:ArsR/SmtB family transcription factor [Acetohalobium arabaticum]|uniref:Transcriptional regulator, ArsR family n=1 Tax=Acetohalobium arabaticum (strain ATCC 49924 / DSM 5501 / Z-7288) TaxID=574087 RepID=D9QT29_ACEAZ|nr:metalloregulator ArsR/SmtB family transcription factor [Acetohalobium arabaticum]ADL13529.1 transcriptional regulator, ArsR family [Acetohalobium arabaticum DSM 5501]
MEQKEENWQERLAQLTKALGHPHRIKIIEILADLPDDNQCIVGSIVEQLPVSQSTVSQHLKVLKEAGWIKGRIDGPRVCYCLEDDVFTEYRTLFDQFNI